MEEKKERKKVKENRQRAELTKADAMKQWLPDGQAEVNTNPLAGRDNWRARLARRANTLRMTSAATSLNLSLGVTGRCSAFT